MYRKDPVQDSLPLPPQGTGRWLHLRYFLCPFLVGFGFFQFSYIEKKQRKRADIMEKSYIKKKLICTSRTEFISQLVLIKAGRKPHQQLLPHQAYP